jgi:hypothetical protein
MRLLLIFAVLGTVSAPLKAQETGEAIILSGGPAIRFFEKNKRSSHDKYWGNFVDSAVLRFQQIRPALPPDTAFTWIVYRPGYADRGKEMGTDLLAPIVASANRVQARLLWFDRTEQLINYLNAGKNRKTTPIVHFDYFGHSNKACFLFDYSNEIDGMSTVFLHQRQLSEIKSGVFASRATTKSWGCHSGESYSEAWKKRFGIPMEGAIGKTDYSRGGLPFLSSEKGAWVQ